MILSLTHTIVLPYNFGTPGWYAFVARWQPIRCYGLELDYQPKALVVARDEVDRWLADPEFRGLPILRLTTPSSSPDPFMDSVALAWPAQDLSWESAPAIAGLNHRRDESYYLLTAALPEVFVRRGGITRVAFPPLPTTPVGLGLPPRPIRGAGDAPTGEPIATAGSPTAMPACTVPANYSNALRTVDSARARSGFARHRGTFDLAVRGTDVPASLLAAIAWRESRFNPTARNPSGALGMFQIMPRTAEGWGLSDPTDTAAASIAVVRAWERYLREGRRRSGTDLEAFTFANSAYGQGLGAARRALRSDDQCRAMYLRRMMEAFERMART